MIKTATIITGIFITLIITGLTMNENDYDYQKAISIADKVFPESEIKLNRDDYILVKIENGIYFEKRDNPKLWKLSYKIKPLFSKEGMRVASGELVIKADLNTGKGQVLSYGD
jgi:hypothetical protein